MMANGWGMGWMWFVWPIGIVAVVLVVALLIRGGSGGDRRSEGSAAPSGPGAGRTRAREILDERYARGELSDEEYQDRLRRLLGDIDQ